MRSFASGASILVAWAACQIGCSNSNSSGSDGTTGSNSILAADLPDAARKAVCQHLVACGELDDVANCDQVNFLDYPESRGFVRFALNVPGDVVLNPTLLAAIANGDTVFDGAKAAACVDAIAHASCDFTSQSQRQVIDTCSNLASGKRVEDAACSESFECRSQVCALIVCPELCCRGNCIAGAPPMPAKLGEMCSYGVCEAGAYCNFPAGTCMALETEGASCFFGGQCDAGLDCVGAPSGTCQARPALGEPCSGVCRDEGTRCDATTSTCVKARLAGAACTVDSECGTVYVCDSTQHCSLGLPDGAPCEVGQRCAGERGFCVAPAGTSGTCTLPAADGAACEYNGDCVRESCDPTSKQCVSAVCS